MRHYGSVAARLASLRVERELIQGPAHMFMLPEPSPLGLSGPDAKEGRTEPL